MFRFGIFVFLFNFVICVINTTGPIRRTVYGKVRGKITERLHGKAVEEYLGVPYAQPPIKSLRFKRPHSLKPWANIRNTDSLPPACPQMDWYYLNTHKPFFNTSNEDCLYMNIFVPKVNRTKLEVLLYIHGGSNRVGMGAMFDGDLLAAFGEIVVINFNYRLGILGFYAHRAEGIEGNLGLLDQVLAMRWVHENVHFFNGDPRKVTAHGHSAAAGDLGLHLVSDLTKGLFRYSIIHSGSPLAFWGVSSCVETFNQPTVPIDCKPGSSHINHTLTYEHLMSANVDMDGFLQISGEDNPYRLVTFRPVVDGYYLIESPDKLLQCKRPHGDSVLLAFARDEFFPESKEDKDQFRKFVKSVKRLFSDDFQALIYLNGQQSPTIIPRQIYFPDDVIKPTSVTFFVEVEKKFHEWKTNVNISTYPHYARMEADVIFYIPMIKLADIISEWIDRVYLLSFDYVSEDLTGPDWQGVPHGWDLFYVFGAPLVGHPKHKYSEQDKLVSKHTMRLFSNYVKYGFLTMDGIHQYETYNSTAKSYLKLHFQEEPVVTQEYNFRKERIAFWNKYLFGKNNFTCNRASNIALYTFTSYFIVVLNILILK